MNMKSYCAIGVASFAMGIAIGGLLGAAMAFLILPPAPDPPDRAGAAQVGRPDDLYHR